MFLSSPPFFLSFLLKKNYDKCAEQKIYIFLKIIFSMVEKTIINRHCLFYLE